MRNLATTPYHHRQIHLRSMRYTMILPFVGRIFLFVRSTAILLDADRQEKRDCDPTGSSVAFAMVKASGTNYDKIRR